MPRSLARTLHVAALPFPSPQGTQAAIAHMLEHEARAGRDAHLLTYAAGLELPGQAAARFTLHRAADFPRVRSLRSGPSFAKVALDARMLFSLRALERELRPDVIIAHHVEAAAQALLIARAPVVFFAHTDLQSELPVYGPAASARGLALGGALLDRLLLRRAQAVAVISPALHERFAPRVAAPADELAYVPTPWSVPEPSSAAERAQAREGLRLDPAAPVLLYAGNLDAYQGLDLLLAAFARLSTKHPALGLLVATESDPAELRVLSERAGLSGAIAGRVRVCKLAGEHARRAAHAAADLAVVPRLAPGGLPIKLLDALARGLPCAASPRACAGLPLGDCVQLAHGDDARALANAIEALLGDPSRRAQLADAGRRYVAARHCAERYFAALDPLVSRARGTAHEPG